MERYVIVWDLETQEKIEDQQGRFREDKIRKLSVSCACTMKLDSDLILEGQEEQAFAKAEQSTFWIDGEGMEPMLKQFDGAELIVGYNTNGFDHLVISKYYRGNRARQLSHNFKAHDMFRRIIDAQASRWPKLDRLLELNGEEPKKANGLQAIEWWKQGKRDLLEEYCKADVALLAKLALRRDGIVLDGREPLRAPTTLIGVAPALAAHRFCHSLSKRKRREVTEGGGNVPIGYIAQRLMEDENDVSDCVDDSIKEIINGP